VGFESITKEEEDSVATIQAQVSKDNSIVSAPFFVFAFS
jgi:hypothetical protein